VSTIDGDIDVGTCFPLSIDVGGLGPRSLVDYTADRNDMTHADVTVVADVAIGCTCYFNQMHWVQRNRPVEFPQMHWVQMHHLGPIAVCTGCKRIVFLCVISDCT
jgi:hypothetical protein